MMMRVYYLLLYFFIFIIIISSCARYTKIPAYNDNSVLTPPDYHNLDCWAAHPLKIDPSDKYPGKKDTILPNNTNVDVFFIHPTTFTTQKNIYASNGDVFDVKLNQKTDRTAILFQASAFNNNTRVFAPRYRQAHFNNYFTKDKKTAQKSFELAYRDVLQAFEYYLKEFNQGRPFIIAGHSQGTNHAISLILQKIDGKPLQNQLIAAYLIGMPVHKDTFPNIKPCQSAEETGCIISWRTFKKGTELIHEKELPILVTNPVSWTTSQQYIPKEENKSSLLRDFDVVYPNLVDAQVNSTVLWVTKPKFRGSFLLRTKNYHPADINFFYFSIRENVATRIQHYFQTGKIK
jgi:hypothetical protein